MDSRGMPGRPAVACAASGVPLAGSAETPAPPPAPHGGALHFPAMEVQIFGVRKSADTRAALRWFAERRIRTHFVDLDVRAASPGELRRFAQGFGVEALLDRGAKRFIELGLATARYGEERWLEKLAEEPRLLRLPLVRWQQRLTIGPAAGTWSEWVAAT